MQVNKLLRISSEDKQAGESNSDFSVVFNNSAYAQNVRGVVVKSISFTNVFPNLFSDGGDPADPTTKANNTFTYRLNGLPALESVTIPTGFYNATQLAAALEAALNLAIAPVVITIGLSSDVNPKFEFTLVGGTMAFLPLLDPGGGTLLNRMANVLGITQETINLASFVAQDLPSLGGIRQAYICSPELSERHTVASSRQGENVPVLTDVPINVPFGGEVFYQSYDAEVDTVMFNDPNKGLTKVSIQLCTRTGRVLDLGQNALTLMVQLIK